MTRVHIRLERRPSQPTADALRRLVRETLRRLDVPRAEVHILITGDEQIRRLNHAYREVDTSTDVLSFADGDELPSGLRLLGELVISLDTARRQALELGHSELDELCELVLHGLIHLVGYDHGTDKGEMDALETTLREELLQ